MAQSCFCGWTVMCSFYFQNTFVIKWMMQLWRYFQRWHCICDLAQVRQEVGSLYHSCRNWAILYLSKTDWLLICCALMKKKRSSCSWVSLILKNRLLWKERQWRCSHQAQCSLTPKVQPSVAACCCNPHTYRSLNPSPHTADKHMLLTVIFKEQNANAGQRIKTSIWHYDGFSFLPLIYPHE